MLVTQEVDDCCGLKEKRMWMCMLEERREKEDEREMGGLNTRGRQREIFQMCE